MEITFYNKMDPRRLLDSTYKDLPSLAPILSRDGEPVIINSQTDSVYDNMIPVNRDVEITGKFRTSFILHNNINFVIRNANLTNAQNSVQTITLANDFTGTITIENSKIFVKQTRLGLTQSNCYAIMTEMGSSIESKPLEVSLADSYIQGIGLLATRLKLIGTNTIDSATQSANSVINCTKVLGNTDSVLIANNLILMQASSDTSELGKIILQNGPVSLEGKWKINALEVNATRNSKELFQLLGKHFPSNFDIKQIKIAKAPRGISVVYADNVSLNFDHATLGDTKTKYNIAVRGSIINMKQTADYLNWLITDKNVLHLDQASLTSLRSQKNKFYSQLAPKAKSSLNSNTEPRSLNTEDQASNQNKTEIDSSETANNSQSVNNQLPGIKPNSTQTSDSNSDSKKQSKNSQALVQSDPMSKLMSLIGLTEVKSKIKDYINTAMVNEELRNRGLGASSSMTRHMILGGNPGTGKTTVANLIEKILYEKKAIRCDKFVPKRASEIIGDVIGRSGKNMRNAINDAIGGVFFLDEAYALDDPKNPYTKEAVTELIQGMDNNRSDLIVILAGYTNKMKYMLDHVNPGLKSRIGDNWINFPDYTYNEELQIFDLFLKEYDSVMDPKIKSTKQFKNSLIYYNRDHSNGRSVRNYVEALIRVRNTRNMEYLKQNHLTLKDLSDKELTTILPKDISINYRQWHIHQKELDKMSKEASQANNDFTSNENGKNNEE